MGEKEIATETSNNILAYLSLSTCRDNELSTICNKNANIEMDQGYCSTEESSDKDEDVGVVILIVVFGDIERK